MADEPEQVAALFRAMEAEFAAMMGRALRSLVETVLDQACTKLLGGVADVPALAGWVHRASRQPSSPLHSPSGLQGGRGVREGV